MNGEFEVKAACYIPEADDRAVEISAPLASRRKTVGFEKLCAKRDVTTLPEAPAPTAMKSYKLSI